MPKVEFTTDNKKATTNFDYPKLKLKVGERARVLILDPSPVMEYVHTLKAPQITNGVPVMETAKRKNGEEYVTNKMDFLSRPICLGDEAILDDKGNDPKNCPMCALAKEQPDYAQTPQRRFALHVIRYRTKAGSFEPITPFSVETVVWSFGDNIFNQLVDFREEWEDLRKHDLVLGPCQAPEMFQKFEINVAAKAAWLEDASRKKLTLETFKENQIPDLTIACGARKERKWIDEDIETIRTRWATALNAETDDIPEVGGTLDEGLSDLLNDTPLADTTPVTDLDDLLGDTGETDEEGWAKEAPTYDSTTESVLGDLLGDDDDEAPAEEVPAPAKKAAPKARAKAKTAPDPEPAPAAEEPAGDDFDDLLAGLDD